MTCYIAMGSRADFAAIDAAARRGQRPRHAMGHLAARLGAVVLQPQPGSAALLDRLAARLVGTPETWALARRLRGRVGLGDVVFCADEAAGIPVAALCGGRGARIMLFGHNLDRPRARAAMRLFKVAATVDLFMAVSAKQTKYLSRTFGIDAGRLMATCDQTDIAFFSPGPAEPKVRPVIASVGLEKRDYRTLAAATAMLDVDVRISGFSADARVNAETFPDQLPPNMTKAFYSWGDLQTLYRTADIVIVSLFPNSYAAGIQGLLEAVASGTPVVVTRTEGLAEYLERADLVTSIDMGDAAAMRAAIIAKLADPVAAREQAARARAHFLPLIDSERHVAEVAARLETLGA